MKNTAFSIAYEIVLLILWIGAFYLFTTIFNVSIVLSTILATITAILCWWAYNWIGEKTKLWQQMPLDALFFWLGF